MKTKILLSSIIAFFTAFLALAMPPNDDIANAVVVSASQTFNNVAIQTATASGVTSTGCSLGGVSTVWYVHTPTSNGSITATILNPGPNLDPAMGRFNIVAWYVDGGGTGATLEERLVLAPGDTCVTGNEGTIATAAGTSYYAQIDNSLTTPTNLAFTVGTAPPPNDIITGAIDINTTGTTNFTGVNTQNATGSSGGGMLECNLGGTRPRVYYRYQPTSNASVTATINNAATSGDILIIWYESAIASATSDADLTLADEDGCLVSPNPTAVGPLSGRTINVTAGNTYYCLIQHDAGPADITFTTGPFIARPPNDKVENATNISSLPFTAPSIAFPNATGLSYGPTNGSNMGSLQRVYYKISVVTAGSVTATIDNPTNNSDTFIIPFRSSIASATADNELTLADAEGGAFSFGDSQTLNAAAGTTYYFLAQNGTPSTVTFTGTATLNVQQIEDLGFLIYPNPTSSSIVINHKNEIKNYVIMNMLGQEVGSLDLTTGDDEVDIDVSNLQSGQYFISITDNTDNTLTERFIKK